MLIFAIFGFSACLSEGGDSDFEGDYDDTEADSLKCERGTLRCEGSILQICNGQEWVEEQDCSDNDKSCISGKCTKSGNALASLVGSGSLDLDFDEYSSYIIAPFSLTSENAVVPYSISRTEESSTKINARNTVKFESDANFSAAVKKLEHRISFDRMLRERAASVFDHNRLGLEGRGHASKTKAQCSSSAQCGEGEICNKGECLSDVPLHFFGWEITEDITAEVAAKGEKCAILVDSRDMEVFSSEDISQMLYNCENIILPRDHFFFGEPTYGDLGDIGDYDGDDLIHVLITHLCNDEEVWGFFYSGDFYEDNDEDYPSNERNIIYVAIPQNEQEMVSIMATIAHEYQHLVHFVRKTLGPNMAGVSLSQSYEETWLDEGFSHLAEDLVGFGTDNVGMAKYYFDAVPQTSLIFDGDTIEQRAMAMLIFRYLYERKGGALYSTESPSSITDKGGAAFLKGMIGSTYFGRENVIKAYGAEWREIMLDWLTTLALDGTGATDDSDFNYQEPFTDTFTGYEIGVKTRGDRMSSWGYPISLEGPNIKSFSGSLLEGEISTWAADFIELSSSGGNTVELQGESENELFVVIGKY